MSQIDYMKGWDEAIDQVLDILKNLGGTACLLLDILPSNEISIPFRISDECTLEFTVRKR